MTSLNSSLRRLLVAFACASLGSCEAWKENVRYWNSPDGRAANAAMMQAIQQQQMLNQRSYEFEQSRLLQLQLMHAETARSMQPIQVQHSGLVDVRHSGTVRISR